MKDVNYPLRKAYLSALTGIVYNSVPVPVYYMNAPDNVANKNYIIFYPIANIDVSTKSSSDVISQVAVKIHTWENTYNNGDACDAIANQVLQAIYPTPNSKLALENRNNYQIKLQNDNLQQWTVNNQRVYIDRTLTFSHNIFIEGFATNGSNITTSSQIQKYPFTGTGGESGFTDSSLANKNIILVDKDGVGYEVIAGSFTTGKQVRYIQSTGQFIFSTQFEPSEKALIIYQ